RLASNGIFVRFIEEAYKNFESAIDSLNDMLEGRKIPKELTADVSASRLEIYLSNCLSFEKFHLHQKSEYDLDQFNIEGDFFARIVIMNYRKILFDIVALNPAG